MKKTITIFVILSLIAASFLGVAAGEGQLMLAGLDDENSGHDWANNLFFERMEEATGVSFGLHQFTDSTAWTNEKQRYLTGEGLPDALFKAQLSAQETLRLYEAGDYAAAAQLALENRGYPPA